MKSWVNNVFIMWTMLNGAYYLGSQPSVHQVDWMCNAESYGERKSGCYRAIQLIAVMKTEDVQDLSPIEVWIEIVSHEHSSP